MINKNTEHDNSQNLTRINKFLSESGYCSRRQADKLIEQGKVTINDIKAVNGDKIKKGDIVKVNGQKITEEKETIYIAFNKPVGITCTAYKGDKSNIIDYIKFKKRIFTIGRLDKNSQGLILLTNDGDIVNKISKAVNHHEKEYIVTVNKPVTDNFIEKMSNGVPILDTVTRKCFVKKESDKVFRIILTQGLNRQIRRMCEYFDYKVINLERIRVMNIKLNELKLGKWRYLNKEELTDLNKLIKDSHQ